MPRRKIIELCFLVAPSVLTVVATACDAPDEVGAIGAENVDLALEFAELAAQERWDDGLEEFLEPRCDEDGCAWTWTDLGGIAGLSDLPEIPDAQDGVHAQASTTLKAEDHPAAVGTKRVTIMTIVCHETQDVGDDEPYLLFNGYKPWAKTNVKNGSAYAVNTYLDITSQAVVNLMEQDVNSNDSIGAFIVPASAAVGEYGKTLKNAGGNYSIFYKVSVP